MNYRIFKPKNPRLQSAIQHFWTLEQTDDSPVVYRLLPGVNKNLVFNLDSDRSIEKHSPIPSSYGLISGECNKLLLYPIHRKLKLMGIMFYPGALFTLLRIPANELQGLLDLDLIRKGLTQCIVDQIQQENSLASKLIVLERELQEIFDFDQDIRFPVKHAMKYLGSSKYTLDEYSRVTGLGRRRIERHFKRLLGLSPKNFQQAARIRKAVHLMVMNRTYRLTHLANICGYYDQSHFNHEFRTFTGTSPGRFLDSIHRAASGENTSNLFSSNYRDPRTRNTEILMK